MGANQAQVPESFAPGEIQGVIIKALQKATDPRGWLAELFRKDELPAEFFPAMAYVSTSQPGVTRGPHEHREQADFFCFLGPANFRLRMWDNRKDSETFGRVMTVVVGEDAPASVLIPSGVVHAYQNIGEVVGLVINCPNRLYMGEGKRERVDEIRYEGDPNTVFQMSD